MKTLSSLILVLGAGAALLAFTASSDARPFGHKLFLNPQPLPPGVAVMINPQPLPPGSAVAINPQPLPPRLQ